MEASKAQVECLSPLGVRWCEPTKAWEQRANVRGGYVGADKARY